MPSRQSPDRPSGGSVAYPLSAVTQPANGAPERRMRATARGSEHAYRAQKGTSTETDVMREREGAVPGAGAADTHDATEMCRSADRSVGGSRVESTERDLSTLGWRPLCGPVRMADARRCRAVVRQTALFSYGGWPCGGSAGGGAVVRRVEDAADRALSRGTAGGPLPAQAWAVAARGTDPGGCAPVGRLPDHGRGSRSCPRWNTLTPHARHRQASPPRGLPPLPALASLTHVRLAGPPPAGGSPSRRRAPTPRPRPGAPATRRSATGPASPPSRR